MSTKLLAIGVSALLLTVVACDEAEPTPDPALAFCDSIELLGEQITALETLDASATVDDVEAAITAVEEAASEARDNAGELAEGQVEAIQTAVEDLVTYRESIEGDETVAQVMDGFVDQVAAVKLARLQAGQVACGLEEVEAAVEEAQATIEAAASAAAEAVEDAQEQVEEEAAEDS